MYWKHWRLPLLLCLFAIGFSNCQDGSGTTVGSDGAQGESDVTTVGADPAVAAAVEVTPPAPSEQETTQAAESADAAAPAAPAAPVVTDGAEVAADSNVATTEQSAAAADSDKVTVAAESAVATTPEPAIPTLPETKLEQDPDVTIKPVAPNEPPTTEGAASQPETSTGSAAGSAGGLPAGSAGSTAGPDVSTEDSSDDDKAATTAVPEIPTLPDTEDELEGPKGKTLAPTTEAEVTTAEAAATEAPTTEPEITTTEAPATTTVPWSGEPCETPHVLNEVERHFTATIGKEAINDRKLKKNWYRAEYEGSPAIITSQAIKPDQCGTSIPFHLNLKGKTLPDKDNNGTYEICSSVKTDHGLLDCTEPQQIEVKNCGDKYVYNLSPLVWKGKSSSKIGICVQKPGEIVPLHYLAISQELSDNLDVPTTSVDDVSKEQLEGIVTLELKYPEDLGDQTDTEYLRGLDKKYRPMVARALNNLPKPTPAPVTTEEPTTATKVEKVEEKKEEPVAAQPAPEAPKEPAPAPEEPEMNIPDNLDSDADSKGPRAAPLVGNAHFRYRRDLSRERRSSDHEYKDDDVHYVGPTPRIKHGVLQKSVYVDDPETDAVDGDRLLTAVKNLNKSGELGNDLNLTVVAIYKGLPRDIQPLIAPVPAQSTWKKHEPVFITIIVLLLLLLLILLIGCCCIHCRKRRGSWTANPKKQKPKTKKGRPTSKSPLTAHESPYPDDEIKKGEGPMTERENPAYTPNGSGGHISKPTDDEGWIVPIEELRRAEMNRPDVQDTRL